MTKLKLNELIGSYDNLREEPAFFNNSTNILAVTITFMVVSWACSLLRLYTRFFIVRAAGWDDFFVVLSLVTTSVGSISICLAVQHGGMGRHFILLGPEIMSTYLKILCVNIIILVVFQQQPLDLETAPVPRYVANASYPMSAGCVKLALLFQYLRVYEKDSVFYQASIVTVVAVSLWSLFFVVLGIVPTVPIHAFWHLSVPAVRFGFGTLYVEPFVTIYTGLTGSNMAFDMIILGLAAPLLLYKRNTGTTSRWALISLFGVGTLASVFSLLRLVSLIQTSATTYPTFDPTWYGSTPIVFAALEVDVAVISAALPVFWPVLRNHLVAQKIMVTREIKMTREHRRLSTGRSAIIIHDDDDDDGVELQRTASSGRQRAPPSQMGHYANPYISQQVNPFQAAEFGVKAGVEPGRRASGKDHASSPV